MIDVINDSELAAMPQNPLDRLFALADSTPDRALGEWFRDSLLAYLSEPDASLDRCLSLAGELGRSPRFRWLKQRRDQHLRTALAALGGDYSSLVAEINRYDRAPRHARERSEPMSDWSPARQAIHAASQVGLALPRTRDGLLRTLANEPALFRLDDQPETGDSTTNQ